MWLLRRLVELPSLGLWSRLYLLHSGESNSFHVRSLPPRVRSKIMARLHQLSHLHMAMLSHCYVWEQGPPDGGKHWWLPHHCGRPHRYYRMRRDAKGQRTELCNR